MKKQILVMGTVFSLLGSSIVYANNLTLDEVINSNTVQEQTQETNTTTQENNNNNSQVDISKYTEPLDNNYINGIAGNLDLGEEVSDTTLAVSSHMKYYVSIIVQILGYILVFGLSVRVLIDLIYISLPFARKFMLDSNSTSNTNGSVGTTPTISGSFNGTSTLPSIGNSSPMKSSASSWLVSNEALNAVEVSKEGKSPFKVYRKSMVTYCVTAVVLLVLAITGALSKLGFFIGYIIVNIINGVIG